MNYLRIFLMLAIVGLSSAHASATEFFGHWALSNLSEPDENGIYSTGSDAGSFSFSTSTPNIDEFVKCAKQEFPNFDIFLLGQADVGGGNSGIVSEAYVCKGEINLSRCDAADIVRTCQLKFRFKDLALQTVKALHGRPKDNLHSDLKKVTRRKTSYTEVWQVTLSNSAAVGSAQYEVMIVERRGATSVGVKYLNGN